MKFPQACTGIILFLCLCTALPAAEPPPELKTRNLVLITVDGLRPEDLFNGPDTAILADPALSGIDYPEYADEARKHYLRTTPDQSRAAVMPFFWNTLAPQGLVLGNRARGSISTLRNNEWFSAPGYIEILTGEPHAEVTTNDPIRYPHRTFMEFAQQALGLGFTDVATIGSWSGFATLSSSREGAFFSNTGYEAPDPQHASAKMQWLGEIQRDIMTLWPEGRSDAVTSNMALEYLAQHGPRLLYIAFGESDDWAHSRRYDRYLDYMQKLDGYLERLWTQLQSMEQYRDRTSLIITTDHGRGGLKDWHEHDRNIEGSQYTWIAVIGPDTPDRGEVAPYPTVTLSDVAATALTLLGLDYMKFNPDAGSPIGIAVECDCGR